MRFAFAGCDRNLSIFGALVAASWQPVKIFSVPEQEGIAYHSALLACANDHHISVQLDPLRPHDLLALEELACDILVVGSYNYKIPDWNEHLPYAINFHPSPLPIGRSPYPLVNAILHEHRHWAVTCHRIDAAYDTGAILAAHPFAIDQFDTHESLHIKIQIASAQLAAQIALKFGALWDAANIQSEGDYWPLFSAADRTIDFATSVHQIRLQLQAFGKLECCATVNRQEVRVKNGYAWFESHNVAIGQVAHEYASNIVIACKDGFVVFNDWHFVQD
ncbi:formyltransferase family protein [Undibacterium sp. Ji67W]|uniref:formyltransferase family protein n=1 Tax=Undibacterium sp. Ji67W TaxID=3413042 RepID=UPI003BF1401E